MARVIKIKKGLDINLKGKPRKVTKNNISSEYYSVFPDDYTGFVPKAAVKEGDKVLAGSPVFFDKNRPDIKIVSPVSGEIVAVNRGEKRKLINVVVKADSLIEYKKFGEKDVKNLSPESIKLALAEAGIFAFVKQRPYDIIANPKDTPRDIFVSGFYSTPLASDFEYILKGEEENFQTGLDALAKISGGDVYLSVRPNVQSSALKHAKGVKMVEVDGLHPAGNAGVQINHIKPVNKGETVWTVNPQDVIVIGRFFNKGIVDLTRLISFVGSEVNENARAYYPMILGAEIKELIKGNTTQSDDLRYISGNVLTGIQIPRDGSLHAFDNQITVIPEGERTHEFVGWICPGFDKFSVSKTYPSFLVEALTKKEYTIDARLRGGRRAMIMSNEWDNVFPMDILPEFLIRAIIAFDIDKMENLGIYEVAPEDFALCEFVDTSKMELQFIVRQGLDLLYKEMN
ncbi:MAG: Na(+)-translocating NADH-quinone reductase subunit A [Dysgonamonadaceae bacterium]|jgi:Na+-transporting NADH:ubiquinone oxidoreductase subunit A|nr:Na(+)-translocating NADH-quinone reductase subunit A [Dysgonamonadaceae bacterium]